MRFKIWGIPYFQLILLSLIPALFWMFYRWIDHADVPLLSLFTLYRSFLTWAIPVTVLFSVCWMVLLKAGVFSARYAFYATAIFSLSYELTTAVFERGFARMGLALLELLVVSWVYRWLENKVELAQINPKMAWYEGYPKSYPQISVEISSSSFQLQSSLRRMDRSGLFVLFENSSELPFQPKANDVLDFKMTFKEVEVVGRARIQSMLCVNEAGRQVWGFGLQFLPKDLYHLTQYTSLVERLRGEGYV